MAVRPPRLSTMLWLVSILGSLALIAGVIFSPAKVPKVSALAIVDWKGYFTSYNYQSYLDCSDNCAGDVAPNHFASSYANTAAGKQAFVNAVEDAQSQYGFASAPFFINAMMGEPYGSSSLSGATESQWASIIESGNIKLSSGSYTGCANSASVSGSLDPNRKNDFVFIQECVSGAPDILIQNASGTITYAQIKISCGNFVGNITTLPTTPPPVPPTGALSVGCNANGTAYAIYKFSDANGATTATLTVNFAGSTPPNATYDFGTADSNGADHTYQIPDPNTDFAGAWGATLDINGVDGSSDTSYTATSGTCDKSPVGAISLSCNANGTGLIKFSFSDPNGNTKAELSVTYGGGSTPPNGVFDYATSGSYTRTIPAGDVEGAWGASLLVYDYGGPNNVTVKPTSPAIAPACAHPPTGSIQAAGSGSCDAVRVILNDVSYTGNLNYYLAIAGNGQGPELTAPENTLTPPANQSGTMVNGYSGFNYWKQNTVDLYAIDPLTSRTSGVLGTVTLPVCGSVSCNTAQIPANLVVGTQTPFTVSVTISGPPGIDGPAGAQFAPITIGGQTTTSAYTPQPPTATTLLTSTQQTYTPQSAGTYTLSWTFGGGADNIAPITCTKSVTAEYEPYFTVLGGDVSAGEGFGDSSTPVNADIDGEDLDAASGYFGASARQGAIATGAISQFAANTTNNVPTNLGGSTAGLTGIQPSGLAFANTTPPITAGSYGGQFLNGSSSSWYAPDYAASVTGTDGTGQPNYATLTPRTQPYVYRIASDQTIGNIVLNPGVRVTLLVTGDVYINGNITYANYGGNPLGESSSNMLANIPQFSVIADGGNISVGSGVTELHGLYVAQPSSATANNGTIYTCATGFNQPSLAYNTCGQSLTFYGAVAAKMIALDRTYANLTKTASISDAPAEQFVFTPELWLGSVSGSSTSCATDPSQVNCLYQSYTSLPPVL